MTQLTTNQPAKADIIRLIQSRKDLADSTKRQYTKAITGYLETGANLTDVEALTDYANGLKKSSRSFLKAAIRLWGESVASKAKGSATPENVAAVQATVYRVEALNDAIQIEPAKGQKAHTWLTQSEVKKLLDSTNGNNIPVMQLHNGNIQGQRDKIVLGCLVGAGLRRDELSNLTYDDIILQPIAGKFRTVLNVTGKGAKDRIVPINDRLAAALDNWKLTTGPGLVARSISKGGVIGDSLSAIGIFHIVRSAGRAIGKPDLAPHDLRRTFAQLGYEAGVPITQISLLLGHSSVATTQRYLNLDLDLDSTVSDFIPFD